MHKHPKLAWAVRQKGTQQEWAEMLGISVSTLRSRLDGRSVWKIDEVAKTLEWLELPQAQWKEYFYRRENDEII